MIKSFRNKALADHFATGKAAKIDARFHKRITVRLDALNDAKSVDDLNFPGYSFHALKGFRPTRYTIHVNDRGASHSSSMMKTPIMLISSSIIEEEIDG